MYDAEASTNEIQGKASVGSHDGFTFSTMTWTTRVRMAIAIDSTNSHCPLFAAVNNAAMIPTSQSSPDPATGAGSDWAMDMGIANSVNSTISPSMITSKLATLCANFLNTIVFCVLYLFIFQPPFLS